MTDTRSYNPKEIEAIRAIRSALATVERQFGASIEELGEVLKRHDAGQVLVDQVVGDLSRPPVNDAIAQLQRDLDRLDHTSHHPVSQILGHPYDMTMAKDIERKYGGTIAELRKSVKSRILASADPHFTPPAVEASPATKPGYRFTARNEFDAVTGDDIELTREYCGKTKHISIYEAFVLLRLFKRSLAYVFDECDLTGEEVRNLESYTPAYREYLKECLAMAKKLGFALPKQEAPAPVFMLQIGGVTHRLDASEARRVQGQLSALLELHDAD